MEQYENYLKAERALSSAKEWNDLPNGPKYQNNKMDISMAHCSSNGPDNNFKADKITGMHLLNSLQK